MLSGVSLHMDADDTVVHVERVRCLECETTYTQPTGGWIVDRNPGCPRCGYVGWISATVPLRSATPRGQRRFAAGLPLRPFFQPR